MDEARINRALARLASEIVEENHLRAVIIISRSVDLAVIAEQSAKSSKSVENIRKY